MYCRRCGKFIDGSLSVCNECVEEMLKNEHKTSVQGKPIKEEPIEVSVVEPIKEESVQLINVEATNSVDSESVVVLSYSESKPQVVRNPVPVKPQGGSRRAGLGKAIASAVIPEVIAAVLTVAYYFCTLGLTYQVPLMVVIGVILSLAVVGGGVISIVFGAQSVKLANNLVKEGKKRPIATMICGIVGIVGGASLIFTAFMNFLKVLIVVLL